MISGLKTFFADTIRHAYECVDAINNKEFDHVLTEKLTESIRRSIVTAHLLGVATGHENFSEDISVLQRILNICQVLVQYQDRVHYFEASAYQNRKGALRGALFVETLQQKELHNRLKKLPFQLEKSFHPERKQAFLQRISDLPDTLAYPGDFQKTALNYSIPLVLIRTTDFDKMTMKLPGELLPDFQSLHAFLQAMGHTDPFWEKNSSLVTRIVKALRTATSLDENFSTVKRILLEEREKTIQLLKGNIFSQYEMLDEWDDVLNMLSTRNDKGLIKLLTQLIRDRKEIVEELKTLQASCEEVELWENYYKKSENSFVTSVGV